MRLFVDLKLMLAARVMPQQGEAADWGVYTCTPASYDETLSFGVPCCDGADIKGHLHCQNIFDEHFYLLLQWLGT
jgi:hypothetical protein